MSETGVLDNPIAPDAATPNAVNTDNLSGIPNTGIDSHLQNSAQQVDSQSLVRDGGNLGYTSSNDADLLPQESKYGELPLEVHGVRVYQGNVNKSEVFNNGENGEKRAVKYQLKMGINDNSLVFNVDPKNPERVIAIPTVNEYNDLSDEDRDKLVVLQRSGNELLISSMEGNDDLVSEDMVDEAPVVRSMNDRVSLRVLDFDPKTNSVIVEKVKNERPVPVSPIPPEKRSWWKKRLIDVIGPIAIGTATIIGGGDREIPPASTPDFINETISTRSEQPAIIENDPRLKCEETTDYEIKSGGSLTRSLIEVNGLGHYLDASGKLDVPKLYDDLACMLLIPENQDLLSKTDPTVANFVKSITSEEGKSVVGPLTPELIFDGLKSINTKDGVERYQGASDQLVIVQPGDQVKVPVRK